MLREDPIPPDYYGLLWVWGHLVGQSPVTIRLLSSLEYLAGGLVLPNWIRLQAVHVNRTSSS